MLLGHAERSAPTARPHELHYTDLDPAYIKPNRSPPPPQPLHMPTFGELGVGSKGLLRVAGEGMHGLPGKSDLRTGAFFCSPPKTSQTVTVSLKRPRRKWIVDTWYVQVHDSSVEAWRGDKWCVQFMKKKENSG